MPKQELLELVDDRLLGVAQENQIEILYACESGSRAWGFPSPDSDYDIRFIYAHPVEWYLSIEEGRDVIDKPIERHALGEIDMGGWDIRKTLRLAGKSNPVIWEWLQSPIVYQKLTEDIVTNIRDGIASCYSPIAACHHYLAICRGTMERELSGTEVKIKKYFYMLRPILAASWIERFKTVPPMEFEPLRAMLDGRGIINSTIDELLERKRNTDERVPILRVKAIDEFLGSELSRLTDAASRPPAALRSGDTLDRLLRNLIGYKSPGAL